VFIKVFGAGKTPPSGDQEPPFPDTDFNHIHDELDAEMSAAPNAFFQVIVLVTRTLDQTDLDTLGAAIGLSTLPVELTFAGPSVVVTLQPNEIELLADQSLVVRIEKMTRLDFNRLDLYRLPRVHAKMASPFLTRHTTLKGDG